MKPKILIVDDDPGHLETLSILIKGWGYDVSGAADGVEAVAKVEEYPFDAVLMDVRMAGMGGIEALGRIKKHNPAVPVLIMTAYSSVDTAVEALKSGAYDYLIKPLDFDALKIVLERALDHTRLEVENRALKQRVPPDFDMGKIIGSSPLMKEMIETIAMAAPTEATVLITGESGTGKELVAKALHHNSPRAGGPLVAVNCAALTETLLESELFGHERGAFTGADKRRDGRFMQAHRGSIFLDEVGEIPPSMQAKLLRVLQEREIQRVGSDIPIHVDVRILAATNKDLRAEADAGNFREDLYYRLNVISIEVPPLRDRTDDIPLLADHFLRRFQERNRKSLKGFTPRAMDMLLRYDWPGNVRELENAVERAVILAGGDYATERELPLAVSEAYDGDSDPAASSTPSSLDGLPLEDVERQVILSTLEKCGGNKSETARILKISRVTLHKKLNKYGVT